MQIFLMIVVASGLLTGCLSNLDKYKKNGSNNHVMTQPNYNDDLLNSPITADGNAAAPAPQKARTYGGTGTQATIYAVDKQTFRFKLKDEDVWDAALAVILKNYHPVIMEKTTGLVSTDWDTYYLKQGVYRNKVTIRVKKVSWDTAEITVHNSVEKLQDGAGANMVGGIWLPVEEGSEEIRRIVQNMAIALNQAPPVFAPDAGMMAQDAPNSLDQPASSMPAKR